jgi:flagellar hook-basal body complex protein FliE
MLLILVLFSTLTSLTLCAEQVQTSQGDCLIRGLRGSNLESIGVKGASYLIQPANDPNSFLSLDSDLKLCPEINKQCLFAFQEVDRMPQRYFLINIGTNIRIQSESENKKHCVAVIKGTNKIHLVFEDTYEDPRPFLLQYDLSKKSAPLTHYPVGDISSIHLWVIKPIYEFLGLNPLKVDHDTLLFKIPKKEKITDKSLTFQQIQGLYDLQTTDDTKKITIVHDDSSNDFLLAYTLGLSYINGLTIMSEDFPLQVFNVKGFFTGIGKSAELAKQQEKVSDVDTIDIKVGEILSLRPDFRLGIRSPLLMMGGIEITPGAQNLGAYVGYYSPSFNRLRVKVKHVIHNKGVTPYPNFAVDFKGDTLYFVNINRNVLTNPGTSLYFAHGLAQNSISHVSEETQRAIERFGEIFDRFGKSIETASINAKQALVESSKNLSDAVIFSATTLENTVTYASKTFENSIKFLSLTAKGISNDVSNNTHTIVSNLRSTAALLNNSLLESSRNLANSVREVSDGLRDSATLFDRAFGRVSQALENSSGNIEDAIRDASGNFVEGMNKIENAANALKNSKVKIEFCCIQ